MWTFASLLGRPTCGSAVPGPRWTPMTQQTGLAETSSIDVDAHG
jgi:hypothetical protein